MPRAKNASLPSTDSLPSTTLIPNSVLLRRVLSRLPKSVIIDLVLIWLDHPLCPIHEPYDEDEMLMQDDETLDDRKSLYKTYRTDNNVTKKMVMDRLLANDWVLPGSEKSNCRRVG